jgi:hypothetical protein
MSGKLAVHQMTMLPAATNLCWSPFNQLSCNVSSLLTSIPVGVAGMQSPWPLALLSLQAIGSQKETRDSDVCGLDHQRPQRCQSMCLVFNWMVMGKGLAGEYGEGEKKWVLMNQRE